MSQTDIEFGLHVRFIEARKTKTSMCGWKIKSIPGQSMHALFTPTKIHFAHVIELQNLPSNCVIANHLHHANKTKQLTILSHFSWCIHPSFDLPFLIWLLIHITAAIESEQTFAKFAFEWNKQFILWALFQFLTCMNDEKVEFLIGFSSIDGHLSSIIAI